MILISCLHVAATVPMGASSGQYSSYISLTASTEVHFHVIHFKSNAEK